MPKHDESEDVRKLQGTIVYPPGWKKANRAREEVAILRAVLIAIVNRFQRSSGGLEYCLREADLRAVTEDMKLEVETRDGRIYLKVRRFGQ